jgi:hypothetical protein
MTMRRIPSSWSRLLSFSHRTAASTTARLPLAVAATSSSSKHAPSRSNSRTLLGFAALGLVSVGGTYLVWPNLDATTDTSATVSTQNVRFNKQIPDSESRQRDPLSILDPEELASSTAHLVELPLNQLMRAYIVFLASSSPTLVDIAPSTIHALEWLRDILPFGLGKPLWGALVLVSDTSHLRDCWLVVDAAADMKQ